MTTTPEPVLTIADARRLRGATVRYVNTGEVGVIFGVSDQYVFVRYRGDTHPKATAPDMLRVVPTEGVG